MEEWLGDFLFVYQRAPFYFALEWEKCFDTDLSWQRYVVFYWLSFTSQNGQW